VINVGLTPTISAALLTLRHQIHADPELAFAEHATRDKLESAWHALTGLHAERVTETGLVLRILGSHAERATLPVIALRGDIDALPIREATGVPWTSQNDGVMHACGHDVHATWALGAGVLLTHWRPLCDVVVLLQPAEEIGAGARAMIEAGALDRVAAIFGAHVDRRFVIGEVVADAGPLAAACDDFTITLTGRGAHAARPQESADPVVAQAAVVLALQTLVARRLNPAWPGVVTVGAVTAGEANNVIPESATLRGTIRTTLPEARRVLADALPSLVRLTAEAYGCCADVRIDQGPPPLVNTERESGWARAAVATELGDSALRPLGITNLAAEDFAYYLGHVPGAFLRIGARYADGEVIAAHSPRFFAEDEAIGIGARVLAACARQAAAAIAESR
jgi:amidohydrolase